MRWCAFVAAVSVLAALTGGCSLSFPIAPLVSDPETTGSLAPTAPSLGPGLDDNDWARASVALDKALDPQASATPTPWSNPDSGVSGSFRADGTAFVRDDEVCRSFRAVLVVSTAQRHLVGTACRSGLSEWKLREARTVPAEG